MHAFVLRLLFPLWQAFMMYVANHTELACSSPTSDHTSYFLGSLWNSISSATMTVHLLFLYLCIFGDPSIYMYVYKQLLFTLCMTIMFITVFSVWWRCLRGRWRKRGLLHMPKGLWELSVRTMGIRTDCHVYSADSDWRWGCIRGTINQHFLRLNIDVCETLMPPFPNMTFDLDLWPTDLKINRDHLLIKEYLTT